MTTSYHSLAGGALTQNWSNSSQITSNDDWSGVPSIQGYLGDIDAGSPTGVDPQTVTGAALGQVDVIANQINPNGLATGGVAEFDLADDAVGLNGSGTADAPSLVFYLDATGQQDVRVQFNVRDIDGSADNAMQQVAVQYRIGETGSWTNLPSAFIADATTGGSATQVTAVDVTLPGAVNNQAQVQVRVLTTNAVGNDEWIGIDDINITSAPIPGGGTVVGGINILDMAPSLQGSTTPPVATNALNVTRAGGWLSGDGAGGAESIAFDPSTDRAYVTNAALERIEILDLSNPAAPAEVGFIDLTTLPNYGNVNSVAVHNGLVAVAVQNADGGSPGVVALYASDGGAPLNVITVGVLPDQLTFSPDGNLLLVANEAERFFDRSGTPVVENAPGTVTIIDVSGGAATAAVRNTIGFSALDADEALLDTLGIKTYDGGTINPDGGTPDTVVVPDSTVSEDIEPEYIAVSPDGTKAYVTLQEVNAVAVIDLTNPTADRPVSILPAGFVDFSLPGNEGDFSDRDGPGNAASISVGNSPVKSLLQPDAIASFEAGGQTYFITANEGDSRILQDAAFGDPALNEARASAIPGSGATPDYARLNVDTVWSAGSDLYGFGGRGFSIFRQNADGTITKVEETGGDFEQIIAALPNASTVFNGENGGAFDTRSDNKAAEPEGVAVGEINGQLYAFVALERIGGMMVWNISDPANAQFVRYVAPTSADFGPEVIKFVSAADSPTGRPFVLTANEISGSVTVYDVSDVTAINVIQGAGATSGMVGQTVTVEAIVTGDFQNGDGDAKRSLNGFYLQEEVADQDGNAATSEGMFVFLGSLPGGGVDVEVGDRVRVTGTVNEFGGSTQLTASSVTLLQAGAVADIDTLAVPVDLPAADVIQRPGTVANSSTVFFPDLEAYEGMLVKFPETLTITEQFDLDRFVEIRLAAGDRPVTFTHENEPDVAGNAAHLQDVASRTITYDDGLNVQNTPIGNLDGFGPTYNTANAPRMGDTITNLTGVIDFAFNTYRVRSVEDGDNVFVDANPRQTEPDDVGGTIQVGSFNVLNFFRTLDDGSLTANGLQPRGANTAAEFDRQVDKLVNVLSELDADVLGLIELENNFQPGASGNAIEFLVNELNAELGAGTYAWVDPGQQFVGGDAIAVGFIYKPSVVQVSLDTTIQILDDSDLPGLGLGNLITDSTVGGVFNGVNTSRAAVAVTFEEIATGGEFTAVVNHFKSKSGTGTGNDADQLDGQGNWQQQREFAATALTEWIETDPTGSGDSDFLIVGDLNAYFKEDTIDIIQGAGFANLQAALSDPYSFVFDGQVGALDYIMANGSMSDQVTGVTEWHINSDEADALDYNLDFGRDPAIFDAETLARVSDHDPLLVGLDLAEEPVFRLQILHGSDFEAGLAAIDDAPRFAAIVDRLEDLEFNSITLASGDNYIPSPFFNASSDPSLDPFFEESIGRGDIRILNTIGIEASVIGNHEFDAGPREVQNLIRPVGPGADGGGAYEGTRFGYLAANLDFTGEPDLAANAGTTPITEASFGTGPSGGRRLGPSMILEENGELIGVVGVTTPVFEDITTPGGVRIIGPRTLEVNDGDDSDFRALAEIVQAQIDVLKNQGINKIIIVSQLQELENEKHLISFLKDVDIVIGGGSNTLLSDSTDILRTGDSSDGPYAELFTNAGGDPTILVNTDGNYKYVGRLVVEFDDQGRLLPASLDPNINGAYATDQAGLERVYQGTGVDPFAEGSRGDIVRDLTTAIDGVISVKDGVQFGKTEVYLEGRRATVRSEETNLGNLSADANLFIAQQTDSNVVISIKNGGGIRDSIGSIASDGTELPPAANPEANKEAGEISQLDIENSLRFNNALSLVTLTPGQLLEALENGVSNPGGIFAHVGGLRFSYDSTLPAGNRVQTVALVDENGQVTAVVVENGEVVAGAPAAIRMVTLSFLIGTPNASQPGGFNRPDGFKFAEYIAANPAFANRVDLDGDASGADDVASRTGAATFTDNGREQDALAEYLAAKYSATPFQQADTPQTGDTRIQNLSVRDDTVLDSPDVVGTDDDDVLNGTPGNETITGGDGDDRINAMGGNDVVSGGDDDDIIFSGAGNDIVDGGDDDDFIFGDAGDDVITGGKGDDKVKGGDGNDVFLVTDHTRDGEDEYDGGNGVDTLDFSASTRSIKINLSDGTTHFGDDEIVNVENIIGGVAGDELSGNSRPNELTGNAGNDELDGEGGNDRLFGRGGHDELEGGDGDDLLDAGDGNDELDGGNGNDQLFGAAGNDKLDGGDGNDVVDAGAGNDGLKGGKGNDQLFAGAGNDDLNGGQGNDRLVGNEGDDQLEAGQGNDVLIGGAGNDRLIGGDGVDQFAFTSLDGIDTITDFKTNGSSQDQFAFDTSLFEGFTGDDGFDLVGGGFLRTQFVQGNRTEIQIDADGGGDAFQAIALVNGRITNGDLADHTTLGNYLV